MKIIRHYSIIRSIGSTRFALLLLMVLPIGCQPAATSKTASSGLSHFSANRRVEYIVGDIPVIISAPHGGRLEPVDIPDRTRGTLVTDSNTDLLARDIADAFHELTGRYPHIIICHLKRTKVDCNRSITSGTQNNASASETWQDFHNFIDQARKAVVAEYGKGLYIDLHGHGQPEKWLELGYLLSTYQLKQNDKKLAAMQSRSSIRDLAKESDASFVDLIRGDSSFGSLIAKRGYPAVPSPENPHAGNKKFFSGGYNTWTYCLGDDDKLTGFQVECPRYVRNTDANRQAFAKAFANAVMEYLKLHSK